MLTDGWPVTAGIDPQTGNPDVQYTSDEHAAILAGLIARDTSGAARAGILPRHTNGLTSARPDMKVDIAPFEAVLVNGGARFIALTEQITRDIAAAPIANTRYDISYVEVTDRALTGLISTRDVKIATGQASAIPQDPVVPAGAVRLDRITVPAGATATNAGVTITPIHQFTAATGGMLLFRNTTEMNAWAAPEASVGYNLADGRRYVRRSGVWRGGELTLTVDALYDKHVAPYSAVAFCDDGWVCLEGLVRNATVFNVNSGQRYVLGSVPVAYAPARTLRWGTVSILGFAVIEVTTTGEIAYWLSVGASGTAIGAWNLSLSPAKWKVK